jgi:release factor glutamine methyltransferase
MPVNPDQVYQPEADTYLLLEACRAEVKPGDRVLEIGTGSGAIAAELVQRCDILATDLNPHAVLCARQQGIEVVQGDLMSGIRGTFDLVLFNPPYLPTKAEERLDDWLEYALDGGPTGREVIERFAHDVRRVLAPGGRILLLISSLTGLFEVQKLFARSGFVVAVARQQTVEDEELYVLRIVTATG